ncbi:MAG: DMT family transporter [Acetobacteraceae bacterium]|nr:DMT family transporter [Acetobacteraceae bacterium]
MSSSLRTAASTGLRDNAADAVRGIFIVLAAYVLLTGGDLAAKWVLVPAGVAALMASRGVAGAATMACLAALEGDLKRLRPVRWRMILLRSTLHAAVSLSWYLAWQVVPLADSYALGFTAPLIMTLLAVPMLGERIAWRRIFSTLAGFSGVLLMLRPGSTLWQPAALVLVPGIVLMAVTRIMTRQLSTTETPEALAFWLLAGHIPAGLLLLLAGFPGPSGLGAGVLLAIVTMGVLNAAAHYLMARAYALAPIGAVAPYEYTMLIWGGIGAYLLLGEVPGWDSMAGGAVVAAAGLYNLHRERLRRAQSVRCSS